MPGIARLAPNFDVHTPPSSVAIFKVGEEGRAVAC